VAGFCQHTEPLLASRVGLCHMECVSAAAVGSCSHRADRYCYLHSIHSDVLFCELGWSAICLVLPLTGRSESSHPHCSSITVRTLMRISGEIRVVSSFHHLIKIALEQKRHSVGLRAGPAQLTPKCWTFLLLLF
jgi:hypothetical protein